MKKTPLYQWHVDAGAHMSGFASYSMPLWYPQGVKKEHIGVITSSGLFDTSHMAVVTVEGAATRKLLQKTFSKDLNSCLGSKKSSLVDGRCVYGVFLNNKGYVIDDAIVYQVSDRFFMVVVNAAMGGVIAGHLAANEVSGDLKITDMTDRLAKIDIQGPGSARILARALKDPAEAFTAMGYFSFKGWCKRSSSTSEVLLKDNTPILLSRTGYTGELGFEIFLESNYVQKLWCDLLAAGGEAITACGLAARDSLRAGAMLPLSHQDIGHWPFVNNPWKFALPAVENGTFSKTFVGSEALVASAESSYTYGFAGYDPRKISASPKNLVLDGHGNPLGEILTCTTDMAIGRFNDKIISIATARKSDDVEKFKPRGLSCGFIKLKAPLNFGDHVLLSDDRRTIKVEIREDIRPDRTARSPLRDMVDL